MESLLLLVWKTLWKLVMEYPLFWLTMLSHKPTLVYLRKTKWPSLVDFRIFLDCTTNLLRNIYIKDDWFQLHLRKMLLVCVTWDIVIRILRIKLLIFLVLGTTKVKMAGSGQTEQEGKLPEFVERRRAALERYLIRTANHPIFQVDPDFREFLECGIQDVFKYMATSLLSLFYRDRGRITSSFEHIGTQWGRCFTAF